MDDAWYRQFAWEAYERVTDLDGTPHFDHVERVVAAFDVHDLRAVAWLHDVIEDTNENADTLRQRGVPPVIVETVEILTRHRSSESYHEYIGRVADAPGYPGALARAVKVADLDDNLARSRQAGMKELVRRYTRALAQLDHEE